MNVYLTNQIIGVKEDYRAKVFYIIIVVISKIDCFTKNCYLKGLII